VREGNHERTTTVGKVSEIVLVGGGHAHVLVVKALAARADNRWRVTLVSRDLRTPYSGMIPGVVAGYYRREQAEIDLVRLAKATGTRLVHAAAVGLDRARKHVLVAGAPPVPYDIASIDVGITPDLTSIAGAAEHGVAVKPIAGLLSRLDDVRTRCRTQPGVFRTVMIGGGAAGIELMLAVRSRLIADAQAGGREPARLAFTLVSADRLLPTHNGRVRTIVHRILADRGVAVTTHCRAVAITPGSVRLETGEEIAADVVLLATPAAAPAWFADTGLALDAHGFLAVGPTLQVENDTTVFAAGDCAALIATPREKAGVYAVRAGAPLAANLRRCALGEPPQPWRPQSRHLSLISTGERHAVASWGPLSIDGAWIWALKDRIGRRWMRAFPTI
jgi:selenide, water dikinase